MKFIHFINLIQLLMLNAFTISYMSVVNALTFLFTMLLISVILNIIMQNSKFKFKVLLIFNVQSFFTIN